MNSQTRSQHFVTITKNVYNIYCFKKLKSNNDFKKYAIPILIAHKQIELLTKWKKQLLLEHKYVTYPRTSEENLLKLKIIKNRRKEMRKIIKLSVKANTNGEPGKNNKENSNYTVGKAKNLKKNFS